MRNKEILVCFILFVTTNLTAQNSVLWGTTLFGGVFNEGTIFQINADGSNFNVDLHFHGPGGYTPYDNLLLATDSNLYGTCFNGGTFGGGTIYRYNPITSEHTDVHDFNGTEGDGPICGVVEQNGILYGVTNGGGAYLNGTLYSYNISTGVYTDLVDMSSVSGFQPYSTPVIGSDGRLYGTTVFGGANGNYGTLYSYDPTTSNFSLLHSFDANEYEPFGGLIELNDGKLYGTTYFGGTYSEGVIFSFDLSDSTYQKIYDFNLTDGAACENRMILGTDGNLYGLTTDGGINYDGVIFKYDPFNSNYTKLFDLSDSLGRSPQGNLLEVGNMLYGTTAYGGANDRGTAFKFDLVTNDFYKTVDFDSSNGSNPMCGFVILNYSNACGADFILVPDTAIPHHYWGINASTGNGPLSYLWSWGDGMYDTIAYPSHTYSTGGYYNICLSVYDSTGCNHTTCIDYNIQKLSAENTIIKVDVVDSIPSIPTNIQNTSVLQSWSVFPNPTSANSFINYTLSTPATVNIDLYDMLGNKMQQLVNGDQEQGAHSASFDAHKLANGVYLLQVRAGDQVAEQKIVLLR